MREERESFFRKLVRRQSPDCGVDRAARECPAIKGRWEDVPWLGEDTTPPCETRELTLYLLFI